MSAIAVLLFLSAIAFGIPGAIALGRASHALHDIPNNINTSTLDEARRIRILSISLLVLSAICLITANFV